MLTPNSTMDKLTRTATAFDSFEALRRACDRRYTPSLRRSQWAQEELGAELERLGYRVFWG
jgi:hypothetical protein